ncbi:hypothetical protein THAOC_03794 [Thalassiosira oceanica]|uniref:Uncharacterized protein n=1 Tax=Thalassiosira oceanica TaxID=159749 RepID=K0T6U7_THAOC|nr:hypothetical protein THAOC_03794 [Thalassiosira oceanica]|eukprot:EJK74518.1 hypothetical protein THAOC_03794 [Thalassiosira oceanica]
MTSGVSRQATNGRSKLKRTESGFPTWGTKARPVGPNDFVQAIKKVKKTAMRAEIRREMKRATAAAAQDDKAPGNTSIDRQQLMALVMQAASSIQMNQAREGTSGDDSPPDM